MRLLRRLGVHIHRGKVVIAPVKLGFILRPQLFERAHGFLGLRPAVVKVAAHHRSLLAVPAGADAEYKAPVAVPVKDGNLLGQNQRVALRHQSNAGAKPDFAGNRRGHCQRNVRFGKVPVSPGNFAPGGRKGAGAVHRQDGMLVIPDGLEAQLLGLLGNERRVKGIGGQGYDDSD